MENRGNDVSDLSISRQVPENGMDGGWNARGPFLSRTPTAVLVPPVLCKFRQDISIM